MAQYAQSQNATGWPAAQWPNQPPFPGPPPIPQGVNPQAWATGYWQMNPAWTTHRYNPPVAPPWAPGYGWTAQGAQPGAASSSYNPFKRIPKQPDPSYWEKPLLENPLGLENMV